MSPFSILHLSLCLSTLRSSHKSQRGDADADIRWENGAQGKEAVVEGAAGGEYVIHKKDVAVTGFPNFWGTKTMMFISNAIASQNGGFINHKRTFDIIRFPGWVDLGLGAGSAAAFKYVRAKVHTQMLSNSSGNNFCLVVSPLP